MKKLVSVKIEFYFVMLVDSDVKDENLVGIEYAKQAIRDTPENFIKSSLTPFDLNQMPFGWDMECCPYGGTEDTDYHYSNLK